MVLGLDWDDTITNYPDALTVLARAAEKVHIITLNRKVSADEVYKVLGVQVEVHVMPSNKYDTTKDDYGIGTWKVQKCKELGIDLMVDDSSWVYDACKKVGIPMIWVHDEDRS